MTGIKTMARKMDSRDVRDRNIALVLEQLVDGESHSRTYLSNVTGLTPATLTSLIRDLAEAGIIEQVGASQSGVEGPRRKAMFALGNHSFPVVVLELRKSEVKLVCQTLRGCTVLDETYQADFRGKNIGDFARFVALRICALLDVLAQQGIDSLPLVGISIPAPVYADLRTIPAAIDFGWDHADVVALIEEQLPQAWYEHVRSRKADAQGCDVAAGLAILRDLKIVLVNDGSAGLWAERHYLQRSNGGISPEDSLNLLYFKTDLGVGGGVVLNNELYCGSKGMAGGLGHMPVANSGRHCLCGRTGCLATVAAPEVMIDDGGLREFASEHGDVAALKELRRLAKLNIEPARSTYDRARDGVKQVLAGAIALLVPDWVIFGGYVIHMMDELFSEHDLATMKVSGVRGMLAGHYRDDAAMPGALLMMRQNLLSNAGRLMHGENLVLRVGSAV
ncbi:ROK family protein [Bifidobacterium colobi]|nr:ROK family protein [Bifidobacterium colobi]